MLSLWVYFLVAGIVLLIVEMLTVTFYLAALGFAALATALATWFYEPDLWLATLVFASASVVALALAHSLRRHMQETRADPLADMDRGATVTILENDDGLLKVRYRDTVWDAVWEGDGAPHVGQHAEVAARDGSQLRIKCPELHRTQPQGRPS